MNVRDLESLPLSVNGADGTTATIPLGQVAKITPAIGPARIDHLDRDRVISVQANTEGRPLTDVIRDITGRLEQEVPLPAGYTLRQGGETEDQPPVDHKINFIQPVAHHRERQVLVTPRRNPYG